MNEPIIIQGGMGAAVSDWFLAKTVSTLGQMGVVSGTALDTIFARRLQLGDPGEHIKRALDNFPIPEVAQRIYNRFFVKDGKAPEQPYKYAPMQSLKPSALLQELTVVANFVEVFLAKEGHNGPVGINYLEKIQVPHLASIYGAMLAGVDYILMGAGIPREVPAVIEKFVNHEEATYKVDVKDDDEGYFRLHFNPTEIIGKIKDSLKQPKFIPIISSAILAITLVKKVAGQIDGFIIEGPSAGGHNAPPRGGNELSDKGEPIWGEKDIVDLEKIKNLGLPFWLAGSYGSPEKVLEALELGAAGVQVGTPFAFCEESGLRSDLKEWVIRKLLNGEEVNTFTDPKASPTGFPFKVIEIDGTLSDKQEYLNRKRICDLGYLRSPYRGGDGDIHYRCPAEPEAAYLQKGGKPEDMVGRKCLCNGLVSNVGMSQIHAGGYVDKPLVTAGKDLYLIKQFIRENKTSYSAAEVLEYLVPQMAVVKQESL